MSKLIPLTQGQFAMVDDDMFDELMKYKWYANKYHSGDFYAKRALWEDNKRKKIIMHRVIMNAPKEMVIDHINHNTLDNRKDNLRLCTIAENSQNSRTPKNNTSGYKGVSWHKPTNKYRSKITVNKKIHYLGSFDCPKEAHKAYCTAAKKYHGEFRYTG